MKTVISSDGQTIKRVSDSRAIELVAQGWTYAPKEEFKKQQKAQSESNEKKDDSKQLLKD